VANDKAEFWTTEQVADHLGITVKDVYESRRRNEFPGSIGTNRGRRLLFRSDLIESGPQEPKTTSDPLEAILWGLNAIEKQLGEILKELRNQRPRPLSPVAGSFFGTYDPTLWTGEEE
jgi:hypothetical protein